MRSFSVEEEARVNHVSEFSVRDVIPEYVIDLDLHPRERWKELVGHKKTEVPMTKMFLSPHVE